MTDAAKAASEIFYATLREKGKPVDQKQLIKAWNEAALAAIAWWEQERK